MSAAKYKVQPNATIKSQLDGECCIRDPHIHHADIPISEVMFENVLHLTVIIKQTLHINV